MLAASAATLALAGCAEPAPEETVATSREAIEAVPAWADAGSMSAARKGPTATPLPGGGVLVAGGERVGAIDVGNVYWESAEVFEPSAGAFSPVPAMAHKRILHVAAPLPGGKVLVAGGMQSPTTAEVFDPATKTWTQVADLAHPRVSSAATALADGRVLVSGGDDAPGSTAEVFDPATGQWSETGTMNAWRCSHTTTLLGDGRVLAAGGHRCDDGSKALKTAEIFTPSGGSGSWAVAGPMKTARTLHAAARLPNKWVMVIGGSSVADVDALGEMDSVELYNPAANVWAMLPFLIDKRALHTATALDNGAVLVAGGIDHSGSVLRSAEIYAPDAQKWVATDPMSHGRLAHAAAALPGGAVLVAGGENQSSAEIYSPSANGQGCEIGQQCASGFCVDGVCCNDVCSGQCVTCALPGAEGTCSKAAAGTDPHHDCGQGGPCDDVCDEAGACVDRVGEVCVVTACMEGGTKAIAAATCQARGGECPAVTVECAPYRCGEAASGAAGCLTKCASIDDCADGYACDPEGRCRSRPDVASADTSGCAASPAPLSPHGAAPWLAGVLLAAALRRARRRGS